MKIGGKVEEFTRRSVHGWLAVYGEPTDRLRLELLLDGVPVATAAADEFRADVAARGRGDGRSQFRITLPDALTDDEASRVRLRIVGSDVFLELPRPGSSSGGAVAARKGAVGAFGSEASVEAALQPLQVFIVGAPRSGTSILFFGLNKILTLPGLGESHVMPVFQRMIHQLRLSDNENADDEILIRHLSRPALESYLFDYIRSFYKAQHGSMSWVDKTPTDEAVHGLPLIETVFPEAKLIATKRTGIEVVNSYLIKFQSSFEDACSTWANTMAGIRIARKSCKNLLEIDQFDIANDPHLTAHRLVQHLGRPSFEARLGSFFEQERVDKSSTHDWRKRLTLADVTWTADQKDYFVARCGPEMTNFGYVW